MAREPALPSEYPEQPEERLIPWVCLGTSCRRKVERWVDRYGLSPEDSEDLRQEVCLRCLQGQKRYCGRARFTTWLYRLTRNAYYDLQRRRLRLQLVTAADLDDGVVQKSLEAGQGEQWVNGFGGDEIDRVRTALSQLRPRYREVLEWKYVDGLSHAEIARRLGITVPSAWQLLSRAKEAFKRQYNL